MKIVTFLVLLSCFALGGCKPKSQPAIAIGFIGPLSGNAVDLGVGPARAMELAVHLYNSERSPGQPEVRFFMEDDEWKGENALPLYEKLREEHGISVLLLSHTDGTIALQDSVLRDGVVMVNSLNNDAILSALNENTFQVGKKTEEAAQVVAARVAELGLKRVAGFYVTNSFMTLSAQAFKDHLLTQGLEANLLPVGINKESYGEELAKLKQSGCDALVFFGYKNLGFAMKQAREMGMEVPFFASTTTLGKGYYENAEGAMDGTEFSFFTENDGNYVLASQFLDEYRSTFGGAPFSVWPAMQGYDAMNMVLGILGRIENKPKGMSLEDWLKSQLHRLNFYQGVCGNLAILEDGSSRGIYFSLYEVKGNGIIEKVRR